MCHLCRRKTRSIVDKMDKIISKVRILNVSEKICLCEFLSKVTYDQKNTLTKPMNEILKIPPKFVL